MFDQSASIEDCPNEILIYIFSYLNPADRLEASLVCIKWFELTSLPNFVQDFYLKFNNCNLSKYESPGAVFQKSLRNYSCLFLKDIYSIDEDFDEVWPLFSQHINELVLKNCTCIANERFAKMISAMTNLKKIKLFGKQTLMGIKLKNVTELDLSESNLSHEDAVSMITNLPALEKLSINWDTIIDIENVARNAVQRLTISFLQAVAELKDIIKLDLSLPVPFYGPEILIELSNLTNIRLNRFSLKTSGDIPREVYQQFFETQSNIEFLELQNSRALTQETLTIIVDNLKSLKSISLPSGTPYFETPLEVIQNLPLVESLSIKVHFEVVEDRESKLIKFCSPTDNLKELVLPNIHTKICCDSLFNAANSFPNLKILDLSFSRLTDDGLKIIFSQLTRLQELMLDKCCEITDNGIIGFHNQQYSLQRVQGLRRLSLASCKRLTDLALIGGFKLLNLKYLNLRNLDKITDIGIETLCNFCPSIDDLNLSNCVKLNHRCIQLIDTHLKRLKCLDVSGCKLVKDQVRKSFTGRKVQIVMQGFYYPLGMEDFC